MYDIIIIGAGTAGLSAAIYSLRSGKSVLLLEEKTYGGQIVNTPEVENYPGIKHISGFQFAKDLFDQASLLGAEIEYGRVEGVSVSKDYKTVTTRDKEYQCRCIIIATGVKKRLLGVDGENRLSGFGVSYCATCDGAFYRGKDVCVAGGGNTALQSALFLSEYCRKVYIIHRRNSFRGEDNLVDKLQERSNIEFVLEKIITKINGDKKLESIDVKHSSTGEKSQITADGLFIAVGQAPDNEQFKDIVDLDESGYIISGEDCKTKTSGIFVAGDCRTKDIRQLTTAAADGTIAALAACKMLL